MGLKYAKLTFFVKSILHTPRFKGCIAFFVSRILILKMKIFHLHREKKMRNELTYNLKIYRENNYTSFLRMSIVFTKYFATELSA